MQQLMADPGTINHSRQTKTCKRIYQNYIYINGFRQQYIKLCLQPAMPFLCTVTDRTFVIRKTTIYNIDLKERPVL